ncbi:hypothetical protein MICRO80W_70025 [Micrococcus luteus]|nr:hypothetical protein MICRO80W_70025 [Micrococcus luteus]
MSLSTEWLFCISATVVCLRLGTKEFDMPLASS